MVFLKYSFLFIWVVSVSAVVGVMHSWHYVNLSPSEPTALSIENYSSNIKSYGVVHFLTPACSCSKNIFNHLMSRAPYDPQEIKETVVLFDDNQDSMSSKLQNKGYEVLSLLSSTINKQDKGSVRGVPLLVIYNKNKVTKYVGGYSEQAITPFTDINVAGYIAELEKGRTISSKPVIGCAVSKEYKKLLDPFGLKYREI